MDGLSPFRRALDSRHDPVRSRRLADRAHRHARRKDHRVLVLDRLFHSGFSLDPRLDSPAGPQLRFSQCLGQRPAVYPWTYFQPVQLLGHRLGAHFDWRHLVKVMLLAPVFRRLGASLEEAARVAGASTATMLRRITLPVLSPMILAVSVLSFIRGLQSFNTELLIGTPAGIYVYSTRIYDLLHREPRAYGEATA